MLSSNVMLQRNEIILGVNSGLCLEHSWLWLFTKFRALSSGDPMPREYLPQVQGITETKKRFKRLPKTYKRLFKIMESSQLLPVVSRRCRTRIYFAQRVPFSSRGSEQNSYTELFWSDYCRLSSSYHWQYIVSTQKLNFSKTFSIDEVAEIKEGTYDSVYTMIIMLIFIMLISCLVLVISKVNADKNARSMSIISVQ